MTGFININKVFSIANVYAPFNSGGKQILRARLGGFINNSRDVVWCMSGNFNVIQSFMERRSRVLGYCLEDFSHFNHFIEDNKLFDLLLCGRSFTWYRGDESSMSRLDRFLLS